MHVWFAWYAFITRGARTGHLYGWITRGARVGRLVCLYGTWCTCGLLVVLVGHLVHVRLVWYACRKRGGRVIAGCICSHVEHVQVTG